MDSLFVALLMSVVLGFALTYRLQGTLESVEPQIFDALGRPHLFANNTISNGLKFQRWVFGLRFRHSHELRVRRLGWILFIFQLVYLCGFVWLLALMLGSRAV